MEELTIADGIEEKNWEAGARSRKGEEIKEAKRLKRDGWGVE